MTGAVDATAGVGGAIRARVPWQAPRSGEVLALALDDRGARLAVRRLWRDRTGRVAADVAVTVADTLPPWRASLVLADDRDRARLVDHLTETALLRVNGVHLLALVERLDQLADATPSTPDALAAAEPERHAVLTWLSDVQPERVAWLWPGRLPLGKLAICDGDPGLSKSTLLLHLAALVSRGHAMPDGSWPDRSGPGGVVILTAEDGLADTVRPRLDAAGADCGRIVDLTVRDRHGDRTADLGEDIDLLEEAITTVGARLVIVDPVMAHLGTATNAHRDQDVRRVLAPLAALADRTGAAIVGIRHLNKAPGGSPLYRGGGSIAFIGAARVGWLVAQHPDDPGRRVLATIKNNLSKPAPSLTYTLEETATGVARIVFDPLPSPLAAADLLGPATDDDERSAAADAASFLETMLADGPQAARFIQAEARAAGIAERTLRRARATLRVTTTKTGYQGQWVWSLPDPSKGGQDVQRCPSQFDGHLWDGVATFGATDPATPSPAPPDPAAVPTDGTAFDVVRCCAPGCWQPAEYVTADGVQCRAHALQARGGLSQPLAAD